MTHVLHSSRIRNIQAQMTERAIELLALPDDNSKFILDIGCGSVSCISPRTMNVASIVRIGQGLSGQSLSEAGHYWVGFDISTAMLGQTPACTRTCLKLFCRDRDRE